VLAHNLVALTPSVQALLSKCLCDIARLVAKYWEKTLVAQLEQLGESEVRVRFARGEYGVTGGLKSRVVKDWLDSKESARKSAREVRETGLSQGANSLARKALLKQRFQGLSLLLR